MVIIKARGDDNGISNNLKVYHDAMNVTDKAMVDRYND